MTKKTKKSIIICGTSAASIALALVISSRFARPDSAPSVPASSSQSSVIVEEIRPANTEKLPDKNEEKIPENTDKQPEYSTYIVINQDFPEAVRDVAPPPKPVINDETALTDVSAPPEYSPEQTAPKPEAPEKAPSDTPQNGDKKDGKIYIKGFGWIADKGGGGDGKTDENMYENGNKIGYFG